MKLIHAVPLTLPMFLISKIRIMLGLGLFSIILLAIACTGVQGPVGPVGSQGEQGAAGATGAQGEQGSAGATGPQGAQGPAGTTGAQGELGPAGATGAQGEQGPAVAMVCNARRIGTEISRPQFRSMCRFSDVDASSASNDPAGQESFATTRPRRA